jgi:hypothetical protein
VALRLFFRGSVLRLCIEGRCNPGISKGANKIGQTSLLSKNNFLFSFTSYTVDKGVGAVVEGWEINQSESSYRLTSLHYFREELISCFMELLSLNSNRNCIYFYTEVSLMIEFIFSLRIVGPQPHFRFFLRRKF